MLVLRRETQCCSAPCRTVGFLASMMSGGPSSCRMLGSSSCAAPDAHHEGCNN